MDLTGLTRWPFLLANLPLIVFLGYAIFGSWAGLGQSIRYALQPNWISFIAGEGFEDFWASLKLWLFFLAVFLTLHGEYQFLLKHFPSWLPAAAPVP